MANVSNLEELLLYENGLLGKKILPMVYLKHILNSYLKKKGAIFGFTCPLIEAHNFILTSPTGTLLLNDGYLGDINNDVSSLYVEIIDKNRSYYKCTICGRKLSRKQRLETHVSCVHGKGEK